MLSSQGIRVWIWVGTSGGKFLQPSSAAVKDSPLSGQHWSWKGGSRKTRGEGIRVQARPSLQKHHNLCVCMYHFSCLDLTFPGQLLVILQVSCHMLPHPEPPLTFQLIKPLSDWGAFFFCSHSSLHCPITAHISSTASVFLVVSLVGL